MVIRENSLYDLSTLAICYLTQSFTADFRILNRFEDLSRQIFPFSVQHSEFVSFNVLFNVLCRVILNNISTKVAHVQNIITFRVVA
jgi:hypothetical protein